MVSVKALAAIAITLMVAVPIGLGYGMASTSEEVTAWTSGDATNVSDLMLNHSTPYYTSYTGPENNTWLTNATLGTESPDYEEIGTNLSTLPIWTTTQQTFTASSITINFIHFSPAMGGGPYTSTLYSTSYDSYDSYWIESSYAYTLAWTTSSSVTGSNVVYGGSTTSFGKDSSTTWHMTYFDSNNNRHEVAGVESWSMSYTSATGEWSGEGKGQNYMNLSNQIGASDYYIFNANGPAASVSIADSGGTVHYYGGQDIVIEHTTNGVWIINGDNYTNAGTVSYCDGGTASTFNGTLITSSGSYANPAEGWSLPTSATWRWFNSHQMESVNLLINIPAGESITLDAGTAVTISRTGSVTYVDGDKLGNYTYLYVVITGDAYTISGIAAWPAMGTTPTRYNTLTIDNTGGSTPFSSFAITSGTAALYRVDNAQIVAGTFPSTKDYTLDLGAYWPDQATDIYINSIAIYGDSLTINGTTYTVTDGIININGSKVKLLHSHIETITDENGNWVISIGGTEVATTAAQPTIRFDGEWSLIVTLATMEETTSTKVSWAPGQFAFDKEDFAAAGLLAAAAAFVVLGLTGKASGPKVALLALICGGGALVYVTII